MSRVDEPEVPICPCSDPGETHRISAHWVRAEPPTGPLVFPRDEPMTARPVDPDRTDAIARIVREEVKRYPVGERHSWDPPTAWGATEYTIADAILTTDDPAAIAALAATLWERHPDALITGHTDAILAALTRAGVIEEERRRTRHILSELPDKIERRLVTPWREAT